MAASSSSVSFALSVTSSTLHFPCSTLLLRTCMCGFLVVVVILKNHYLFDYFCRQITIWFKLYFSISSLTWFAHVFMVTFTRSVTLEDAKGRFLNRPCSCVCEWVCVYESIYVLLLSTHRFDYYLSWSCI